MITIYGDLILDVYMNVEFVKPSPESTGGVYKLIDGFQFSEMRLGGAAAVAAITKNLGGEPCLIAPISKDKLGYLIAELVDQLKIVHELDWIDKNKYETTTKFRHVCNGKLLPDRFDREDYYPYTTDFTPCGTTVISDYGKGACHDIAEKIDCYKDVCKIIVDPFPDCIWLERYKGAHVIKCNRAEAMKQLEIVYHNLWDDRYANEFVQLANDLQCYLVVTNGPNDIFIYNKGVSTTIGVAVPRVNNVVDVTGCGDTITAVLAVELNKTPEAITFKMLSDALVIAAKYAAKQVETLGINYKLV